MEHDWKKLHSFWKWQPKTGTRQKRVIFFKAVRHPSLSNLVIIFIWIDEGHIINSMKIIWIFIIAKWGNVDLTEKQHARHQQLCRIPLSPLDASSRLPRSRDHIFSHSMLKARVPQGPDLWYVTFYENRVPIYQTKIPHCHCPNQHKTYVLNSSLVRHMPSHTGERQFQCTTCEVSWSLHLNIIWT